MTSRLRELAGLLTDVRDAADGIPMLELGASVLGRPGLARPFPESEYAFFLSPDVGRTLRYLTDVIVPSSSHHAPGWLPESLKRVFFHETTIEHRPDQAGRQDSFPREEWIFINGILTDPGMAGWNETYLARLFHRPFTIIQNATDGPVDDLLECADEKAFGMNGEPADVGFPVLHRALKNPGKERIVIIAHSQGTLITAVMLRLLALVYQHRDELMSADRQASELAALKAAGVTRDPGDFEDVTRTELSRLEVYCFANCASQMRYVDGPARLPWMESFANQYDLVARLGMLAPHPGAQGIAIDGARWTHPGAWGHLLNAHYLHAIALAHAMASDAGPAAPYIQTGGAPLLAPRLFDYLHGGAGLAPARTPA